MGRIDHVTGRQASTYGYAPVSRSTKSSFPHTMVISTHTPSQNWMAASDVSPMTNEALGHKLLIANKLARDIIQDIIP